MLIPLSKNLSKKSNPDVFLVNSILKNPLSMVIQSRKIRTLPKERILMWIVNWIILSNSAMLNNSLNSKNLSKPSLSSKTNPNQHPTTKNPQMVIGIKQTLKLGQRNLPVVLYKTLLSFSKLLTRLVLVLRMPLKLLLGHNNHLVLPSNLLPKLMLLNSNLQVT